MARLGHCSWLCNMIVKTLEMTSKKIHKLIAASVIVKLQGWQVGGLGKIMSETVNIPITTPDWFYICYTAL